MCNFPNIDYQDDFRPLNGSQNKDFSLFKSPRAMYTFLVKRGFVPDDFLASMNVVNRTQLEETIFHKIQNFGATDLELKEIFCLIHIWGGITGRAVFIKNPDPSMNDIVIHYKNFVNVCLSMPTLHDDTLENSLVVSQNSIIPIYNALVELHKAICGLGPSFLTKHVRFWLTKTNPQNPLPIYDSTFAEHIMGYGSHSYPQFKDIVPFWRCMIKKAHIEQVSLLALERQLFNYFN